MLGIYDDDPEVITLSRSDFGESSMNFSVFFTARHYAMLMHYMLSSYVCLSVTSLHCTKTAKHKITPTMLYDSPRDKFSAAKNLGDIPTESSLWGSQIEVG